MTPFGARLRKLRDDKGVSQKTMAKAIGVSPAYLSALEHGKRGRPTWPLVQRIIQHLNIIWDEAEELIRLSRVSHPRIAIDTSGLNPAATELANELAKNIRQLTEAELADMLKIARKA